MVPTSFQASLPSTATSQAKQDVYNPFTGGTLNMANNTGLYVLAGAAVLSVLLWKKL